MSHPFNSLQFEIIGNQFKENLELIKADSHKQIVKKLNRTRGDLFWALKKNNSTKTVYSYDLFFRPRKSPKYNALKLPPLKKISRNHLKKMNFGENRKRCVGNNFVSPTAHNTRTTSSTISSQKNEVISGMRSIRCSGKAWHVDGIYPLRRQNTAPHRAPPHVTSDPS